MEIRLQDGMTASSVRRSAISHSLATSRHRGQSPRGTRPVSSEVRSTATALRHEILRLGRRTPSLRMTAEGRPPGPSAPPPLGSSTPPALCAHDGWASGSSELPIPNSSLASATLRLCVEIILCVFAPWRLGVHARVGGGENPNSEFRIPKWAVGRQLLTANS